MGKAGMATGKGGVALLGVCSHPLTFLIKEPEFLEVCERLGGAEWSGGGKCSNVQKLIYSGMKLSVRYFHS